MQGNNKLFNIILFGLMGISAVLALLFFLTDSISEGVLLGWCYVLMGVATLVSVVFPIMVMAKDPKKAKTVLFGIVGLIAILGIGYALAGNETYKVGEDVIDATTSKMSGGGLIAFYILIIGAIGAIVYSEVTKALK